jgi:hypothetical protein
VKAPRAVVRRVGNRLSRYEHALRTARPAAAELRHALAGDADLGSAVARFRGREAPTFFFPRGSAGAIAAALDRADPRWRDRTIADADAVCDGIVRVLGADRFDLGEYVARRGSGPGALPWHDDVLNEYRWDPRSFYRQVPVPYDRADMKVPWELSRFQHLTVVGTAYAATRDARYAREVVTQIDDWIAANPVGYGINWVSTMDVAMRAVGWLWAYHLVSDAPEVSDGFVERLLSSLLQHGRHVERNLSIYEGGITTNHTVADYAALVHLGVL